MRAIAAAVLACWLSAWVPAQTPVATEADLQKEIVQVILRYGRSAKAAKVLTKAKDAWELIVAYDTDHREARKELGFEKYGGAWEAARGVKKTLWIDRGEPKRRQQLKEEWDRLLLQIGALHREHGLRLIAAGDKEHGEPHLRKALEYDGKDEAAHKGLGRDKRAGFFGTKEQVAFVDAMKKIEADAKALAAQPLPVERLAAENLPEELKAVGLPFFGSKSEHFTVWTRNSQDEADACAQWGERALVLMRRMFGDERVARLGVLGRLPDRWLAFVNGQSEREKFLQANPDTWKGERIATVRMFDDMFWRKDNKKTALVWTMPDRLFDRMVGFVFYEGILRDRNEGFGQGVLHTATWLLLGTTFTWYGALPDTVAGNVKLRFDPQAWLARLREQIDGKSDVAIQQLPRERLSSYRLDVRQKVWWLAFWLMARHPDQWAVFHERLSNEKVLMPERIDAIGLEVFGRPLGEIELEWREWASGDGDLARATGHGR